MYVPISRATIALRLISRVIGAEIYGALLVPASIISFYLTSKGVRCTLRTFSALISHESVLQRRRTRDSENFYRAQIAEEGHN